jgi:hypothetical protein
MGYLEDRCAAMAARALGARGACRQDTRRGQRIRDFDLVFHDRPPEPLEVTMNADGGVMQTKVRVGREREQPPVKRLWLVFMPQGVQRPDGSVVPVDVDAVWDRLARELPRIEAAGMERLDPLGLFLKPEFHEFGNWLMEVGVHGGSLVPEDGVGGVQITTGHGGVLASDLIADAVEIEAARTDNREKLDLGAPRRHLFVLLTPNSISLADWALLLVLEGKEPMPRLPTLPPEITTVWAGGPTGAIHVTPPGQWEAFLTTEGLWDDPSPWLLS